MTMNNDQSARTGSADDESRTGNIVDTSIDAGTAIAEILRPTFGPTGRDKMLVDSNGMVVVTNDGKTILGEMDVELDLVPAGKLMNKLAQSQGDGVGDGSKTAVILAGELLRHAGKLLEKGLHPTSVADGYRQAAARTVEAFERYSEDVAVDDTDRLQDVARMAMTGRGPIGANEALANLVVKAVQMVEEDGKIDLKNVTTQKATGGAISDSVLVEGLIVDTADPVDSGMPTSITDARIACIGTSLNSQKTDAEVSIRDPESFSDLLDFEDEASADIVDALRELDVNVVLSDDTIGDTVQMKMAEHGILAIKRVTPEDLRHIRRATGAFYLFDMTELESEDIGRADSVRIQNISGDDLLVIEGCANPKSISLLLRGGTEHSVDEAERAVKNSCAVVRSTLLDGRVLPGGGACEVEAALTLRKNAQKIANREQLAVDAFADALESLPRVLAENMARDPIDIVLELRTRHAAGKQYAGVTPDQGVVDNTLNEGIVEPYSVKAQAVTGAAEIAAKTLRIDDLISADELDDGFLAKYGP